MCNMLQVSVVLGAGLLLYPLFCFLPEKVRERLTINHLCPVPEWGSLFFPDWYWEIRCRKSIAVVKEPMGSVGVLGAGVAQV